MIDMQKWRPKHTIIRAEKLTKENAKDLADLCIGQLIQETDLDGNDFVSVNVMTLGGIVRCGEGMYLVLNEAKQWQVMMPTFFERNYEPV